MSVKDKLIAEGMARAVAAFTTKNFQNVPRPLVETVKKTPPRTSSGSAIKLTSSNCRPSTA